MRYIVVGLIWLGLVIVGIGSNRFWIASAPVVPVAGSDLGLNRLLMKGDFDLGDSMPQYLTKAVRKGEPVSREILASNPLLPPRVLIVTMPVESMQVYRGSINANTEVRLCKNKSEIVPAVRVIAVLCPPAQDNCTALLAVPTDKAKSVADGLGPDVVVTTAATCG